MENSGMVWVQFSVILSLLLSFGAVAWYSFKKINQRRKPEKYSKIGISTAFVISMFVVFAIGALRFATGYLSIIEAKEPVNLAWGEEIFNSFFGSLRTFSLEEEYKDYIIDIKRLVPAIISSERRGFRFFEIAMICYATALNIIAPIAGGAIVLEVLSGIFPNIKLRLSYLSLRRKKCFFSELNASSLALAKNILLTDKKERPVCIFTDTYIDNEKEKEYELLLEAKQYGAICVRDDLAHVIKPKFGKRDYYLMDEMEFGNLQTLMSLVEDNNVKFVKNSNIYLFVKTDAYVQIEKRINNEFENGEKKKLLKGGKKPSINPVNGYCNLVRNLLREVPLYEPLIGKKEQPDSLNVTIFGNGIIGTEAFLNTYFFGQMLISDKEDSGKLSLCKLNINVVSKDSEEEFWSKIDYVNPEIKRTVNIINDKEENCAQKDSILSYNDKGEFNDYYCNVRYKQADVKIGAFWNREDENTKHLLNSDYYIVSLGTDADNISVAEKLRLFVGKKHTEAEDVSNVVIAYAVFDSKMSTVLNKQNAHQCYKKGVFDIYMHAFGNLEEVYSCDNVRMTKMQLRQIAKRVSNAYYRAQYLQNHIQDNLERAEKKEESNYNFWADIARALHIKYKAFSLGLIEKSIFDFNADVKDCADNKKTETYDDYVEKQCNIYRKIALVESAIEQEKTKKEKRKICINEESINQDVYANIKNKKDRLAWLEHRRWNAFTRTMGYQHTKEYKTNFALNGKNHKNMELKLHPCLVEAKMPDLSGNNENYMADKIKPLFEPFCEDKNCNTPIKNLQNKKEYFENRVNIAETIELENLDFLDSFSVHWCKEVSLANKKHLEKAIELLEKGIHVDVENITEHGCYDFKMYDSYHSEFGDFGFESEIFEKLQNAKVKNPGKYCNHGMFDHIVCCMVNEKEEYLISLADVKSKLSEKYAVVKESDNVRGTFKIGAYCFASKTNVMITKFINFLQKM